MLPLANQARKAIWTAVNPHTGIRRIDEAFPKEIRRATREHEMQIEFVNGATFQVLGSDNFQGSIGSSPAGIVFSEWAQADPAARGYLRPILMENNGWQLYITTPRGDNHAKRTYLSALNDPDAFAFLQTVEDTGIFTAEQMERERQAYIDDYGEDFGNALFDQEYFCSFQAAIIGAYYGREVAKAEREGRIGVFPHDPRFPVSTAWDLGRTDDTAIWWFQVIDGRVRLIDFYSINGKGLAHYCGQILGREVDLKISTHRVTAEYGDEIPEAAHRKAYRYAIHYLPHDARQKRVESAGKSSEDQVRVALRIQGAQVQVLAQEGIQTGIQAVRTLFPYLEINDERCFEGVDAIRQYRREWSEDRKTFLLTPFHDWTSHPADALRYLAMAWKAAKKPKPPEPKGIKPFTPEWLEYDETKERPKVRYR